jgi:nucleoside phosphorylase
MEPFDFGIITVIEDEFEAILDQFSETPANTPDRHSGEREYGLRQLKTVNNRQYNIAIANCGAQGNLPSKDLAEDMIRELKPRWLLLVGIAGAIPSSDFGLGDVAISSYIHDFSLEALLPRGKHEFSIGVILSCGS